MIYRNKGFTLVELLVSMSIIVILTVLASMSYVRAQKSSRDRRRIEDLKSIQVAAEQYYLLSNGNYLSALGNYTSGASWKINGQTVLQRYPSDPKNDSTSGYVYTATGISSSGYCVCAKMEIESNSNAEDTNCTFVNTGYFCVKNQQ